MENRLHLTTANAEASRPGLHQPVGLPLVTNGPDSVDNNANNDTHRDCGRCWVRPRI